MTTTKSYSERLRFFAIYRSSLKNQMPFAIVSSIVFAILIPVVYIIRMIFDSKNRVSIHITEYIQRRFSQGVLAGEGHVVVIAAAILLLTIVAALVQTSYMHNKRMVDVYHALPIKRQHLIGANTLAAFTTVFGPFFVMYLLTMAAQLVMFGKNLFGYYNYFRFAGLDLLVMLVLMLVIYTFIVLIAVNVGTVFESFMLAMVVGFIPLILYSAILAIWAESTYGAEPVFDYIAWLSPFTFSFQGLFYLHFNEAVASDWLGFTLFAVWALLGIAFWLVAMWCYKRRKSEIAEQTKGSGVFQIVAKCFAAFCGGAVFLAVFWDSLPIVWMIWVLVGSVLIGIIAELILSRGIRYLKKNLKWLVVTGFCVCALVFIIRADPAGYEKRMPDAANIASVKVYYHGRLEQLSDSKWWGRDDRSYNSEIVLTDPASIAVILDAHRIAVENQPPKRYESRYLQHDKQEDYPYLHSKFEYQLKKGQIFSRTYNQVFLDARRKLEELENKPDYIEQAHAVFFMDAYAKETGKAYGANLINNITIYNGLGANPTPHRLSVADTEMLLEAVRTDMLAESLEEIRSPSAPALGYLEFQYRFERKDIYSYSTYDSGFDSVTGTVIVTGQYKNTIAALEKLGLMEELKINVTPNSAEIYPAYYIFGSNSSILSLNPNNMRRESVAMDGYGWESIATENSSEISKLLQNGRHQVMQERNLEIYIVNYFEDSVWVGCQIIREENFPERIRKEIEQQWNRAQAMSEDIVPLEA